MNLYVSDLDGTLLNNNAEISPSTKKYLNAAINNGINFTVATARTPATIVRLLEGINITIPIISMNGSAIFDIKNNCYSHYITIDNELINPIQNLIKSENLNAFAYSIKDNHLFVYHDKLKTPYQIKFYEARKNTCYKTFIEKPLPENSEVLYFTIMDLPDKVNSLYEKLKLIDGLSIVKYMDTYNTNIMNLEIYKSTVSKAHSINFLKNFYNFNTLICFGDNLNDIPMFRISDECYAVKNAVKELKEIATDTIGPNYDDSVAKFIFSRSN